MSGGCLEFYGLCSTRRVCSPCGAARDGVCHFFPVERMLLERVALAGAAGKGIVQKPASLGPQI